MLAQPQGFFFPLYSSSKYTRGGQEAGRGHSGDCCVPSDSMEHPWPMGCSISYNVTVRNQSSRKGGNGDVNCYSVCLVYAKALLPSKWIKICQPMRNRNFLFPFSSKCSFASPIKQSSCQSMSLFAFLLSPCPVAEVTEWVATWLLPGASSPHPITLQDRQAHLHSTQDCINRSHKQMKKTIRKTVLILK